MMSEIMPDLGASPGEEVMPSSKTSGALEVDASTQSLMKRSQGRALSTDVRANAESSLRHNFSEIRIHTTPEAAQAAKNLNANALAFGHDIYFAEGQYDPVSKSGRKLLMHELVHPAQTGHAKPLEGQGRSPIGQGVRASLKTSTPSDPAEQEAERIATQVVDAPKADAQQIGSQGADLVRRSVAADTGIDYYNPLDPVPSRGLKT